MAQFVVSQCVVPCHDVRHCSVPQHILCCILLQHVVLYCILPPCVVLLIFQTHHHSTATLFPLQLLHVYLKYRINGPYSLFVCASYFDSCSVHARFASVTFINCKWHWGCRHFRTSCISMFCIEAIELIIR